MTDSNSKLYALHTSASIEQIRSLAVQIAARTGHTTLLEELPAGSAIEAAPKSPWTLRRFNASLVANSAVVLAFHFAPEAVTSSAGGYLIGWMVACVIFTVL